MLDVSSDPDTDEWKIDHHWVKIDEKNFPDDNFREFLSTEKAGEKRDGKNIDQDGDGWLNPGEIAEVKEIACYSKQIEDLTGIEYFTELDDLDCQNNSLTRLDVSKNTKLRGLGCYYNHLTELKLNTELRALSCGYNSLTELDLTNTPNLQTLICWHNKLTELNVSNQSDLKLLNCGYNRLTSLDLHGTEVGDYTFPESYYYYTGFMCDGNSYGIKVEEDNTYDLSNLLNGFDLSKVKEGSWKGATVEGNILTVDKGTSYVTYTYDCGTSPRGNSNTAEFHLSVTNPDVTNPANPNPDPNPPADGGDTGDTGNSGGDGGGSALAAVAAGIAAGAILYESGTGIYRLVNMPGIPMPSNRGELAMLLWEHAGKPEPVSTALYSDITEDDIDLNKAARWAVEQGLMQDDSEKNTFNPRFPVSKLRTCLTWNAAKEKGLFAKTEE